MRHHQLIITLAAVLTASHATAAEPLHRGGAASPYATIQEHNGPEARNSVVSGMAENDQKTQVAATAPTASSKPLGGPTAIRNRAEANPSTAPQTN